MTHLKIRHTDGKGSTSFSSAEWKWDFYDKYVMVWNADKSVSHRFPYYNIYQITTEGSIS
ncbi:hypothetical protein [Paraburkholderia phymatum]|uniref:hypothetical protein n=1 Tax=Paraburkholderia phymatum TaxID=148447 RepID=UPI0034D19B90